VGIVEPTSPGSRRVTVLPKRYLAGLLAIALLTLAGCSNDSSSSADPATPSTTSAEPSSTPPETEAPETAEEFVRRWVEVSNEMQNTGETTEYRSISQACRPCIEVADQVEGYFKAGGYVKTDGWTIRSIEVPKPGAAKKLTLTLDVDSAPTEYVESAGGEIQHFEGGRVLELVTMSRADGDWAVLDLEQQAK
jgi:hypothetical protein